MAEEKVRVEYARLDSAIGQVWAARTEKGLLCFGIGAFDLKRLERACGRDGEIDLVSDSDGWDGLVDFISRYFRGERVSYEGPLDLRGLGEFSAGVLGALARIPYGETRTYGQVGAELGNARYSRAVGRACAANPLPIIIPCHRVVGADGQIGGYSGPPGYKRRLLDLEGAGLQPQMTLNVRPAGEDTQAAERSAFTAADLVGDWHVHPNFSSDADEDASVEAYCERALETGLPAMCFTTHADLNPEYFAEEGVVRIDGALVRADDSAFARYCEAVASARAKYEHRNLRVHLGVEFDYGVEFEEVVAAFVQRHPFEFVIGSVHTAHGVNFSKGEDAQRAFKRRDPAVLAEAYFAEVAKLARSGLADAIGHFDVFFRYGLSVVGEGIYAIAAPHLDRCLRDVAEAGIGLEVNTWGLRGQTFGDTHPSRPVLRKCAEAGVPVIALGSDAHKLEHLAYGFDEARSRITESRVSVRPFAMMTRAAK